MSSNSGLSHKTLLFLFNNFALISSEIKCYYKKSGLLEKRSDFHCLSWEWIALSVHYCWTESNKRSSSKQSQHTVYLFMSRLCLG